MQPAESDDASPQQLLHTRKLCSCNALLTTGQGDGPSDASDTALYGAILLNSPASSDEEFAWYIRLFEQHRGCLLTPPSSTEGPPRRCTPRGTNPGPYFLCADGAFAALRTYCASHLQHEKCDDADGADGGEKDERSTFTALRLCDALVGDMDSLTAAELLRFVSYGREKSEKGEEQRPQKETDPPLFYDSLASVPMTLLQSIQRRRDAYRCEDGTPMDWTKAEPLVVVPIQCQMTTDFHKCVALLQRLWALDTGTPDICLRFDALEGFEQVMPLDRQSSAAASLEEAYRSRMPETVATMDAQAGEDAQEGERCRRLLTELHTSMAPQHASFATHRLHTRVLPNVVVFRALGGRVDHEFAAVSCVLRYARVFHLMVVNQYNILFACWPDGVTQLVMPPSFVPPTSATDAAAAPCMCGVITFGFLREMETVGLEWNLVKGRPERYDGYTGTSGYRLTFDGLISACNSITSPVVTIDARPLHSASAVRALGSSTPPTCNCNSHTPLESPPTLFSLALRGSSLTMLPGE